LHCSRSYCSRETKLSRRETAPDRQVSRKEPSISSYQRIRDPYASLRYPAYRNFITAIFLFTIAFLIQEVALGYELYTITHDPLALGLTGLATFVPFIGLSLFGGHLADRMSRRLIILVAISVITLGSLFLHFFARSVEAGNVSPDILVPVIYATVFMIGVCRAFQSPASSSLRAFLVPIAAYENAATWSTSAFQAGAILGPAIAGFLFSWLGFSDTLLVVIFLFVCALFFYSRTGDSRASGTPAGGSLLASVREGVGFVWKTKVILYALSLDLFSVLFGGVFALLPIYAQDILNVGAPGLGILRAAQRHQLRPLLGHPLPFLLGRLPRLADPRERDRTDEERVLRGRPRNAFGISRIGLERDVTVPGKCSRNAERDGQKSEEWSCEGSLGSGFHDVVPVWQTP